MLRGLRNRVSELKWNLKCAKWMGRNFKDRSNGFVVHKRFLGDDKVKRDYNGSTVEVANFVRNVFKVIKYKLNTL